MGAYSHTVGDTRYCFNDLKDLLAKPTPARFGDFLAYIQRNHSSGEHILNLMNRLEAYELKRTVQAQHENQDSNQALDYFSSQLPTQERTRMFSGHSFTPSHQS